MPDSHRTGGTTPPIDESDDDMRRSYVRVAIVWILTLAALFAFQELFSGR